MIRVAIRFVLLLAMPSLLATCEQDVHQHEDHPVPFAYGAKSITVTTCGDTAKVRHDGKHVLLDSDDMELLGIERPE